MGGGRRGVWEGLISLFTFHLSLHVRMWRIGVVDVSVSTNPLCHIHCVWSWGVKAAWTFGIYMLLTLSFSSPLDTHHYQSNTNYSTPPFNRQELNATQNEF